MQRKVETKVVDLRISSQVANKFVDSNQRDLDKTSCKMQIKPVPSVCDTVNK